MSTVFVFLEVFSSEGGIQSYVQDILKAYCALNTGQADVFILRDSPGDNLVINADCLRFHYLKTSPAFLGRIRLALSLATCLLFKRPHRLFCGHIKLAPLIYLICITLGIPYTVLTYGKEIWQPLKSAEKKALFQAREIWTISRYSREQACTVNGLNPEQFQILPCGVDGEIFKPAPPSLKLIEKYNLNGFRVLLTVARLWPLDFYKGVDVTIQALPLISQTVKNVKYLIIGRGDDRPRLEKLAAELGVGEQVVFTGFVESEELVEYYRVADVYVMPSQEGFGIAYLEAMACGVPVVAGDGDGSADALLDGKLGWRVPYRATSAVANACLEALEGTDRRCDGEWLREQVIENFSQEALEKRLKFLIKAKK